MKGLRVISGKAKGRKLNQVPGSVARPISDRVKEALFNILGEDIRGASFLDLFAGTGSVGIEALSRGAAFVRFVDVHRLAIRTIRANLERTALTEGAEVLHRDAFTLLEGTPDRTFDYIFIAPPQYHSLWKRALLSVDIHPGWLSPEAWVIVQIDPREYLPCSLQTLTEFDQRRYGSTMLLFFEHVS